MTTFNGFCAGTYSVSGMSRLVGIDFAAGLGAACGGGPAELDDCDCDPAALDRCGGAVGEVGLAFGGGCADG